MGNARRLTPGARFGAALRSALACGGLALALASPAHAQAEEPKATPAAPTAEPREPSAPPAPRAQTQPRTQAPPPAPQTPAAPRRAAQRATPAPVADLQVTQVAARLPRLRVYFDARAEAASGTVRPRRAAAPKKQNVRLTVGRTAAVVDTIAPFKAADGIAYVFLMDVSRSLRPSDFSEAQQAVARWIDRLGANDQVAVVAFGQTVRVAQDFTADKARARAAVDNLSPNEPETQLHEALLRGADLARRADTALPDRRALVVFSDGVDDFPGGVQRDEVLRAFQQNPVPLYALGVRPPGSDTAGLDALGGFARASGGAFFRIDKDSISTGFRDVKARIGEAFVATATCEACAATGAVQRVQLTVSTDDGRTLSDGLDVRVLEGAAPGSDADSTARPAPDPARSGRPLWAYGLGALLLAALAGVWAMRRRSRHVLASVPSASVPDPVAQARSTSPAPAAAPSAGPRSAPRTPEDVAASIAREDEKDAAPPGPTVAMRVDDPSDARPVSPPAPGRALPAPGAEVTPLPAPAPAPPAPVVLVLTPMQGGDALRVTLRTEAFLGRSAARADVVVPGDASVSSRHARLSNTSAGVMVEDAGSTNGTVVNGVPLAGPRRLEHGDLLRLGQTELRVTFER